MQKISKTQLKKGDTIIEVTIAFAIFSLVAIITVAMMNLGIATSERSLELVTARSEINAQAEAIRFIYNSYISESKLPKCVDATLNTPCQKYRQLWKTIVDNAISSDTYSRTIPDTPKTCNELYEAGRGGSNPLKSANAFVINARKLSPTLSESALTAAYYSTRSAGSVFRATPLSSRIIYQIGSKTSDETMAAGNPIEYKEIAAVEGMWVVAVKGKEVDGKVPFYDFYIRSCWYGSNAPTYSSLDSVIRLYKSWKDEDLL